MPLTNPKIVLDEGVGISLLRDTVFLLTHIKTLNKIKIFSILPSPAIKKW